MLSFPSLVFVERHCSQSFRRLLMNLDLICLCSSSCSEPDGIGLRESDSAIDVAVVSTAAPISSQVTSRSAASPQELAIRSPDTWRVYLVGAPFWRGEVK
ncbi:unnamed protein product [Schistosoma curassoni]|nr:unnamed protein product [Schistosoma curassoni]